MTEHLAGGLLTPASGVALDSRLQQASGRAAFLSRLGRDLSGALHTTRAVDLLLGRLVGPVADWAQIVLADRRGYLFRARQADGGVAEARLPGAALSSRCGIGRVLATGGTDLAFVPDGEDADGPTLAALAPCEPLRESLALVRPLDVLTLPLTARGTTYGALSLARRGGTGFDRAAVAFLEDLAHHVALILDTTRALADSRRVARVLSRAVTPPALPTLSGVELASYHQVAFEQDAVGGDFYDVHGGDAEWTVVMGDVCGKGVEAAVLTGKVRQAVRTAALVDRAPAAVLELTNRVLLGDAEDTFVTAVCARGRRRADTLELDVATAGHPPPFVVRRDGSVAPVPVSGTVLGLLAGLDLSETRVSLAPGETCLLYTDGVLEAPGRRDRFGEERLRRVLEATGCCAVGAQVESLAVAVSAHLQDRAHDDIAILGVQAAP